MKFFGWEILTKSDYDGIQKRMTKLEDDAIRPALSHTQQLGAEGVRLPYYAYPPMVLYDLAVYCAEVRTILMALKRELFRKGIEVKPKFVKKCLACSSEFENDPKEGVCPKCFGELRDADTRQKDLWESFSKSVNENNQDMKQVLENINYDADVLDDGFMLILKDYFFDDQGNVTTANIKEVLRGDPLALRIIADRFGRPGRNDSGEPVFFCLEHRDTIYEGKQQCPVCGKQMFRAHFKADYESGYSAGTLAKSIYYSKDECFHKSKYHPSLTYGSSPMASVWNKVLTLMWQDSYIKDYYGKERPPKGLLFVNTSNTKSLQKSWLEQKAQQAKNPHDVTPIGIEFGKEGTGKLVEWIEFVKPLQEMQYTESRMEYRRTIGAVWGVQPVFQSDIATSGGLNNEGLQIAVTNRASELGKIYVDAFLAEISRQLGITDYEVVLPEIEAKDEMSDLLLEKQKIDNALGMKSLGFDVEMDDEGEFEFSESLYATNPLAGQSQPSLPAPVSHPAGLEAEGSPANMLKSKAHLLVLMKAELAEIKSGDATFVAKAETDYDELDLLAESIYDRPFSGVPKRISDKVKAYLIKATAQGKPQNTMVEYVRRTAGVSLTEAERIVKTETHELKLKLREIAYEDNAPADALFKWVGPSDSRTTDVCASLTAETKKGVTLPQLKALITKKAHESGFEPREFTPHYGCRHVFVRAYD